MYVTEEMLTAAREKYGTPDPLAYEAVCPEWEMDIIIGSMKHGRAHDITLFIFNGEEIAVTAKHSYQPEMYRPPSGGLQPGESVEDGAAREAMEETGLSIKLKNYILRIEARFYSPTREVDWTSHIFIALYTGGDIGSHDPEEIREARWATRDEFPLFSRLMRLTDSGGLHYRAFLQEEVLWRFPGLVTAP
jgi:ADP-ribose pyrophosphatase YjhB (NUDIX family)